MVNMNVVGEISLKELDAICSRLHADADRIELQLCQRSISTLRRVIDVIESIGEARMKLADLYAYKNHGNVTGPRADMIRDLVKRYRHLDGWLKEVRNDMIVEVNNL